MKLKKKKKQNKDGTRISLKDNMKLIFPHEENKTDSTHTKKDY